MGVCSDELGISKPLCSGHSRTILAVFNASQALKASIVQRSKWLSNDRGHCDEVVGDC